MSIHDAWKGGARAHLGVTVPGFPNLFLLYGPNTNLAHNSIIFMIECQVRHILACLDRARAARRGGAIEPTVAAADAFDAETQARVDKTVWAGGCSSWYMNDEGRITNNWSGSTIEFWKRTRRTDFGEFAFTDVCSALRPGGPSPTAGSARRGRRAPEDGDGGEAEGARAAPTASADRRRPPRSSGRR